MSQISNKNVWTENPQLLKREIPSGVFGFPIFLFFPLVVLDGMNSKGTYRDPEKHREGGLP